MATPTANSKPLRSVPTWENGVWSVTDFYTEESFKNFVTPLFKEPGKYEFDETAWIFNEQAQKFRENGTYCDAAFKSKEFTTYWDDQKNKCRAGVIFKNKGKTWYLPREYYMWINFLKINDKVKKKFDFPNVWDVQYHISLYNLLAELNYLHSVILKKRQIASSYLHCAKLINEMWFEETPILKMGAALKDKVSDKGSWKYLEEYRNFLNKNTAWYRPMNPGGMGKWEQKIEVTEEGRTVTTGLKGALTMLTFEKDASAGVGGPCRIFFHEEYGIAPKGDETYRYAKQAMRSGMLTTGIFIGAGSVGDLDKCEPLKKFIYHPRENGFYSVECNLVDEKGTIAQTGLFIPEQWSMPPYIDEFGNSDVEGAMKALDEEFKQLKKDLDPADYQLEISQRPRYISEAFAFRKVSKFPIHLISAQKKRIEDKAYPTEYVELFRNVEGKVKFKQSNKLPITEFPLSKKTEDKEGVVVIHERPIDNPDFLTYFGSIDPVGVGKTNTSDSLCSIYIYKNDIEVTRVINGEPKTFIEHGKLVASWTGRFDDLNKTHERLEMLIELYNAWTIVENNISHFIIHMINKKKQKYLVPKNQIIFLKDLGANENVYQEYGWKNTGNLFKEHLLNYGIEFLKEEIDQEVNAEGEILKTQYGIERIPDIMLLKEMEAYDDGVNVDRLVAYCALVAFVKVQQANRGYKKRLEEEKTPKSLEKSENLYKLSNGPFRHIGMGNSQNDNRRPPRYPFKNFR